MRSSPASRVKIQMLAIMLANNKVYLVSATLLKEIQSFSKG